jgi:hypothetical protein
MRGLDLFTPRQIRNRARQFHALRAMIGTRRQIELTHRCSHQTLTLALQPAKLASLLDTHVGIPCSEALIVLS